MDKIKGIAADGGLAIGKTVRFSSEPLGQKTLLQKLSREFHDLEIRDMGRIKVLRDDLYEKISGREETDKEIDCFKKVIKDTRKDLLASRKKLSRDISPKLSEIIDFQILALKDANIYSKTIDLIKEYGISAYLALSIVFNERIELLRKSGKGRGGNRSYDLVDLYNRLVSGLKRTPAGKVLSSDGASGESHILVARKMYPTDLAEIDLGKIKGMVIERQNLESHTSILIRSLKIPYMIKTEIPAGEIPEGKTAVLDCYRGILILEPDKKTLDRYTGQQKKRVIPEKQLAPITAPMNAVYATVNTMQEAAAASGMQVDGIGLFRTELSFLNEDIGLAMDDQVSAYRKILGLFPKKPVTIRTLDLGGDKSAFLNLIYKDELPEKKKRSFIKKLCSRQLEALITASSAGSLMLAFPMISRPEELSALSEKIESIKEKHEGLAHLNIPVCAFIETPAAVYSLDEILDRCDHISVGTNDLLFQLYAESRQVNRTAASEDFLQPPTVRILADIIDKAHKKDKKVTICGGITSSPKFLPILVGLEADSISVELKRYSFARNILSNTDPTKCRDMVRELLEVPSKKDMVRVLCEYGHGTL